MSSTIAKMKFKTMQTCSTSWGEYVHPMTPNLGIFGNKIHYRSVEEQILISQGRYAPAGWSVISLEEALKLAKATPKGVVMLARHSKSDAYLLTGIYVDASEILFLATDPDGDYPTPYGPRP